MRATVRLALAQIRRRGIGQVLVLVVVAALASAAVVAGLSASTSTGEMVDDAYERAGRPDLVLFGTPEALRAAADDDAVDAASAPALRAHADTLVDGDRVDLVVTAVDSEHLAPVGAPRLAEGRWPAADDEVVVERSMVTEGVVDLGGDLRVTTPTGPRSLRVVGDAIDLMDCFWPGCDPLRVFGTQALTDSVAAGADDAIFVATYRLVDADAAAAVGARLAGEIHGIAGQNYWPDTRSDILTFNEVFSAMVAGFGAFLLAAACFVVAGATTARLVARRRSLALLRAVGFRPRQLTAAVLVEHLLIGAVGVVVGWVVGSFAAPLGHIDAILDTSGSTFRVPMLVTALVLVEAFLAAAVVVPAWRADRQPATEILRDAPPTSHGGRVVAAVARRLGAGPSLVAGLRRTLAHPLRAGLAAAAIFVAAVGAVVATGFIGSIDHAVDDPARTGNPYEVYVNSTGASDDDIAAALDASPEVASWFTTTDRSSTIGDGSYTARILGGDHADYRVHEGHDFARPGDALVGYGFLEDTGLDVGDRMTVHVDGASIDVTIAGWYSETADGGKMVLLRDESVPPSVELDDPTYRLTAAGGVSADELAASVTARLGDGASVVVPDYGEGVAPIIGTMIGFAVLLAGVALADLLATTVSATRERARALGVLRTIGCTTRQLIGRAAVGAGLLGLVAGIAGVPFGLWLFRVLSDGITSGVGMGPGAFSTPSLWLLAAVVPAATVLAAGSGALAAVGLSRRPAAELVRYE